MEKDYSYSSQVNRRLASSHFLISSYELLQERSPTPSQQQALVDSILLQLYFACFSYCNELLSHHGKSTLKSDSFNLAVFFDEKKYEGVSEFNEIGALYDQKNSGLFQLCQLFENLISVGSKEEQEENRKKREAQRVNANSTLDLSVQKNNLINIDVVNIDAVNIKVVDVDAVTLGSLDVDFSDLAVIKNLLCNLQELIDRQREYLLEY